MAAFSMYGAVIHTDGDHLVCKQYLGQVNTLLFGFRTVVLGMKVPFYQQEFKYGDVVITLEVSSGNYSVYIFAPITTQTKPTQKLEEQIPPSVSEGWHIAVYTNGTDALGNYYEGYILFDMNFVPERFVKYYDEAKGWDYYPVSGQEHLIFVELNATDYLAVDVGFKTVTHEPLTTGAISAGPCWDQWWYDWAVSIGDPNPEAWANSGIHSWDEGEFYETGEEPVSLYFTSDNSVLKQRTSEYVSGSSVAPTFPHTRSVTAACSMRGCRWHWSGQVLSNEPLATITDVGYAPTVKGYSYWTQAEYYYYYSGSSSIYSGTYNHYVSVSKQSHIHAEWEDVVKEEQKTHIWEDRVCSLADPPAIDEWQYGGDANSNSKLMLYINGVSQEEVATIGNTEGSGGLLYEMAIFPSPSSKVESENLSGIGHHDHGYATYKSNPGTDIYIWAIANYSRAVRGVNRFLAEDQLRTYTIKVRKPDGGIAQRTFAMGDEYFGAKVYDMPYAYIMRTKFPPMEL